jgi:7-cyano-7-deazaguanine synthase in queuosine biosynthesis
VSRLRNVNSFFSVTHGQQDRKQKHLIKEVLMKHEVRLHFPNMQTFKDEAQTALFKDPVRTAQQTLFISVIKTNQFMLEVAQVAVCSQINTKHINTVWTERTVVEC